MSHKTTQNMFRSVTIIHAFDRSYFDLLHSQGPITYAFNTCFRVHKQCRYLIEIIHRKVK